MKKAFLSITMMFMAFTAIAQSCPDGNHPHAIDLGLPSGTKWACCNVDASKPEEDGGYYAWGETTTKSDYSKDYYELIDGVWVSTNHDLGKSICGTQHDVAHVKWGGLWQMPSLDQIEELLDNCKSEWTTVSNVNGYRFIGPNGGSVFLPASGGRLGTNLVARGKHGDYWSGMQNTSSLLDACSLSFGIDPFGSDEAGWSHSNCSLGFPVRPVCK